MYADIEVKAESDAERLARKLIDKCLGEQTSRIAKTRAQQFAPVSMRKVKEFNRYLDELIAHNYAKLVTINRTQYIELNPLLLK